MPQLTVNKKNKRAAMKNVPFSRQSGFLNHRITEKTQKTRSRYSPASDAEKGKIPKIRANSPFKTG